MAAQKTVRSPLSRPASAVWKLCLERIVWSFPFCVRNDGVPAGFLFEVFCYVSYFVSFGEKTGDSSLNVIAIKASVHYTFDHRLLIQNLSAVVSDRMANVYEFLFPIKIHCITYIWSAICKHNFIPTKFQNFYSLGSSMHNIASLTYFVYEGDELLFELEPWDKLNFLRIPFLALADCSCFSLLLLESVT